MFFLHLFLPCFQLNVPYTTYIVPCCLSQKSENPLPSFSVLKSEISLSFLPTKIPLIWLLFHLCCHSLVQVTTISSLDYYSNFLTRFSPYLLKHSSLQDISVIAMMVFSKYKSICVSLLLKISSVASCYTRGKSRYLDLAGKAICVIWSFLHVL